MYHPEFTREGNMITLEPQDLLPIFERAQLSGPRQPMRGSWSPRFTRGSGLFSPYDVTPLLTNESKEASAQGKTHWSNLKSSTQRTASKVGRAVKNKISRKNPKYDTLLESDSNESHETNESIASDSSDEEISDNITEGNKMISKQIQKPTHSRDIIEPEPTTSKKPLLSCSKCEKQFTVKGNLTRHMSSVHETNNWKCSKCSKTFSRSDKLKIHIKSCNQ
jgi:hypothetical protein